MDEIPEGEISLDSPAGRVLGFTSDKFDWGSYLWRSGDSILISFIYSIHQGKGNLSALFNHILELGFSVKVPTPFPRMEAICKRKGFRHTMEDSELGSCEVWVKWPEKT